MKIGVYYDINDNNLLLGLRVAWNIADQIPRCDQIYVLMVTVIHYYGINDGRGILNGTSKTRKGYWWKPNKWLDSIQQYHWKNLVIHCLWCCWGTMSN